MLLVSVDGSLNDCGVAVIEDGKYQSSYTFKTEKKADLEQKIQQIADHFSDLGGFDVAVVELPNAFVRKGGKSRVANLNFPSLQALHLAIGAIVAGLRFAGIETYFISVREWKGSSSKKLTQQIVQSMIGKKLNTHEADAFLMGMQWLTKSRYQTAVKKAMKEIKGGKSYNPLFDKL